MAFIDSGPVEASDLFCDVPKSKWRALLDCKRDFLAVRLGYDCRCLVEFCEEAEIAWEELGYESVTDMIRHGYELDPVEIEVAVAWLKHNEPERQVSLPEAVELGKRGAPLGNQHASKDESKQKNKPNNIRFVYGTDRSYTLARLHRDHPELAQRVERGELSANAAAIEAGFRKKPTPLDLLRKAWGKATEDDRRQFLEWINE